MWWGNRDELGSVSFVRAGPRNGGRRGKASYYQLTTYSVQVSGDVPAGVDGGFFAAELDDFPDQAHGFVREGVEVLEVDAGGGDCFGHGW